MNLDEFKQAMARQMYGMTIAEANEAKICISCKEKVWQLIDKDIEWREWKISALCPNCFPKE